jgi:NTE family protein
MASAAIPMVFPSKKIQQQHYGDGSIHQLSPLSPAIHLGAKKIFVIGVEQPCGAANIKGNMPHPPTTSTIAGHLLDGIFSDTLQSDIERMKRINSTIALIPEDKRIDTQQLRNIDSFTLNPSDDFNSIAVENYQELPYSIRLLLRCVGITNDAESSLISYLLFEKKYCQRLIELGYQDAMEKERQIRAFLAL